MSFHPLQPSWTNSTYNERFEAIKPYVEGKRVLDIGVTSGHRRADWVHAHVAEAASQAVGVDIDAEGVDAVKARGYDVRLIDAQGMDLGEQFEVVFAGELIEHLGNCGEFLEGVKKHLAPGGQFVVTTPNVFCFSNFVYRFGFDARVHYEHTCWFCEDTLRNLLERYGFRVVATKYLPHTTPGRVRKFAAGVVHAVLPDKLAWRTVMVIAEHA